MEKSYYAAYTAISQVERPLTSPRKRLYALCHYHITKHKYSSEYYNRYYMDELINNINLGRFSRAIVNIAPSMNIRMKANNIFAIYRELIPGFETLFVGCVPPELCKNVNKIF